MGTAGRRVLVDLREHGLRAAAPRVQPQVPDARIRAFPNKQVLTLPPRPLWEFENSRILYDNDLVTTLRLLAFFSLFFGVVIGISVRCVFSSLLLKASVLANFREGFDVHRGHNLPVVF